MPNPIAITVTSLSKSYKLFSSRRDRIKELIDPRQKIYHQKFNALKDINLIVENGDVLGIIGQNGSGKSTLLKILSSVVVPSSGTFHCNGKVSALLELGGGFNNDLTGVENIYFLGGIQGYSRNEMNLRIPGILEFADIGKYASQPVSTYSSGMYLRLAFSIAINIDPEILIIDEALAVGDLRFQQKCFRKIKEFKETGKTIVICSHNLNVIKDFCTNAIWLHDGKIKERGNPLLVADRYFTYMTSLAQPRNLKIQGAENIIDFEFPGHPDLQSYYKEIKWTDLSHYESIGNGESKIQYTGIINAKTSQNINQLQGGEEISVLFIITSNKQVNNANIHLVLNGQFGSSVFRITNLCHNHKIQLEEKQPVIISIGFKFPLLGNGRYTLSAGIVAETKSNKLLLHWMHDALIIEVINPDTKYQLGSQLVIEKATFEEIQLKLMHGEMTDANG